jgi:PAS domain S-box-containing protein
MARHYAETLLRKLPVICGGAALLIGVGVLAGGDGAAPHLGPSVALGFILLGAAQICAGGGISRWRLAGRFLAGGALLLGGLGGARTILVLAGPAAGGSRLASALAVWPGSVALGTAAAFVFGGLALLSMTEAAGRRRVDWPALLGIAVLADVLITLLAFLFGLPVSLGPEESIRMGLEPALLHLLLGIGLLALCADGRFMRIFFTNTIVGLLARRMIMVVLLLPPVLGLLRLHFLRYREMGIHEGLPVFVVFYMLVGTLVTFWAAGLGGRLENQRQQAEDERERLFVRLQEQAAGLQEQVGLRTRELEEANRHLHAAASLNNQLSLVASHTTSGVVITDGLGRVEWVNKAWEHMSGYTLGEALGRKPGQLLRGRDTNEATTRRLREAIQQGQSSYEEILNYAKDGRPYWQILDIEPVRNEAGEIVNFISVQTDITQYRESQQQLQGLTERLQLVLHFSGFGVWEVDVRTGRMAWDPRMHEIYGLTPGRFDGTREGWGACLHPEDRKRTEQKLADLIAQEAASFDIEFRIVRQTDGAERYLEAQGYLQRDESGQPLRVIGLNRDITAEQKQREQLLASSERLQLVLQASGFGVWDVDVVAGKIYWDARLCEIYGVQPEQFNGAPHEVWNNLVHPDDREQILDNIRVAAESADVLYNEYRIIRTDGKVRHIQAHGHLRRNAAGQLIRATGMDRDVTAEKEMQEALRLAEERWQLAVTSTNDGVWDWNLVSGSIFFDQRYAEILGYPMEELSQDDRSWMVLVHPDDLTEAMAARETHLAGQTALYSVEHRMRSQSGAWKWVHGRGKVVVWDSAGRPLRMVGTLSDISERKQLEQTLRRNQELADHVGRLAMIGGWEYHLRDNALFWSPSVRRIHDVPDDYLPRVETAMGFYPPEIKPVLLAAFNRCVTEGEPYDLELPMITAADRRLWVRTLGRAETVGGRRVRIYGAYQDITERHESEEGRRQLETQLFQAQKMDTLGTLAGGIAHDFNNLLTGIMGYHDLAADMLDEDHQVRAYLGEARQASLRARELVEQILTFSRQNETPERMPLDLTLLLGEAQRFLRATLPSTIQIQSEVEPGCPRVNADATQLHQVLLNLGTNGAQAMGERGGILKFTLNVSELDAARAAALGGLSSGRYVCLTVSDWGQGMDDTTLRRIFDPFFTTKKPGEGTGLGLSVVHGIVRNHQGGIEVESTVGVGTTFRVYLPEALSEAQMESPQNTAIPQGQGGTVFLVDDEEVVAKFAGIALERLGYRVLTFGSALPCLETIKDDPASCDVLVTDYTMPGLTGTDLIEAVHKINPALRVVLMSGYFTKVSTQTLDRLRHVELLNKPFTSEELALAVQRALTVEAE